MGWLSRKLQSLSRRRMIGVVGAVLLIAAAGWAIKVFRYRFIPRHLYIVEPGGLYRGGQQAPTVLRGIIQKYRIRTIVNLDDKVRRYETTNEEHPDLHYAEEKAIARELSLRYYGFLWKGSGIGPYEEYDAVADILATTSSRPIFFHCAAGEKRANAALAAYWIRHRGYTLEQVIEGLIPYGLHPQRKPDLLTHLRGYYEYVKSNPQATDSSKP